MNAAEVGVLATSPATRVDTDRVHVVALDLLGVALDLLGVAH